MAPEERMKRVSELIQEANQRTWSQVPPLDLEYDLFIDQDIFQVHVCSSPHTVPHPILHVPWTILFQRYQLHRVICHDTHRHSPAHSKRCAESLILLGQVNCNTIVHVLSHYQYFCYCFYLLVYLFIYSHKQMYTG